MVGVYEYQDMPRPVRHAIVRNLSQRVLDIVTAHHPEPVLGAEIEAQITENSSVIKTEEGSLVSICDESLAYAREQAVRKHGVNVSMRGNQLAYRLSDDIKA